MLDRERRRSDRAVASENHPGADDSIEHDSARRDVESNHRVEMRSDRTTIVPKPLDELDSEVTSQRPPLSSREMGGFELDDPDVSDPDSDEPTLIGYNSKANQSTSNAAISFPLGKSILDAHHPIGVSRAPGSIQPPPAAVRPPPMPLTGSVGSVRPPPVALTGSVRPPPVALTGSAGSVRPPPVAQPGSARPPAAVHPPASTQRPLSRGDSQISQAGQLGSEHSKSDKWYLRVQLNAECVADLWVRDLTPHNVLVWSEDMQTWVPLLTVRELRDAIRDAHDSKTRDEVRDENFVFLNTQTAQGEQQALPPARPSTSMATAAAPRTSQWSLPKQRTISNVPPPLLTSSVPVVASPNPQQIILPQPRGQHPPSVFTVPPVVTPTEVVPELISEVEVLPEIPRPARMPSPESISPFARSREPAPLPRPSAMPPPPSAAWRRKGLLAALPLMHVERLAWLAAGVAVASAVALLLRDGETASLGSGGEESIASAKVASASAPVTLSGSVNSGTVSGTSKDDVHRLEDLPVVSAARAEHASVAAAPETLSLAATSSKGGGKERAAKTRKGAVEPAHVTLSSSPTPAAGSNAGAFDTAAARRILTSAATRASRCASEGSASGSVLVTFAPSGFVQSANMAGIKGQGTNVGCVLRAFQEARVAPFSGAPVTVRKAFSIP